MQEKILVVDDNAGFLNTVVNYLTERSFSTMKAASGEEAMLLVPSSKPDLVLLDSALPGVSGHDVCRRLKKQAGTASLPIIIMSGTKTADRDVLSGFEGGADDYIAKPFSMSVLVARIRAVLRRYAAPFELESVLKRSGIELDPAARTAKISGKPVALTRKEFDLLATLIGKPGHAFKPIFLLEAVWGYDPAEYNDAGTVEAHIYTLRKKLGPKLARHIVSLTGHGYKFEE
ncbi:MAG: response regulator transcription factor [Bdellovibrionota bacterium]